MLDVTYCTLAIVLLWHLIDAPDEEMPGSRSWINLPAMPIYRIEPVRSRGTFGRHCGSS